MKKGRKRRILIDMAERQLVLNSTIVDKYPGLKKVLIKYERIYERDIMHNKDFDEKLRNIILFVFKDIKKQAEREWYGTGKLDVIDPPNKKNRIQCSLCGTRNIYIYYIKNRYNGIELNVGSECIEKFPGIDQRLPKGMTIKQYKNKKRKEYAELKRLEHFNKFFPNIKQNLSRWNKEYNNLPIILPLELHMDITNIHRKADLFFKNYIKGKEAKNSLDKFQSILDTREKLIASAYKFIKENKDKKFICTKKIYNWILKENLHDKEEMINKIRNNHSIIAPQIVPLIYEKNFVNSLLEDFKFMLTGEKLTILKVDNKNIYFKFQGTINRIKAELFMTSKYFMKRYGNKLFEKKQIIDEKDIISRSKLVVNKENYTVIEEQLQYILVGTTYKVYLDYENLKYGLEFINTKNNTFASNISPHIFFNNQKEKILLKNNNAKKDICKVISKINNWRPLSDKEKYDIGDISKKPEDME